MGLFQFKAMLFDLSNASNVFQQLVSIVMNEMKSFVMAYLEDSLVFTEKSAKRFDHLQQLLDWLREHGLNLKLPKCPFLREAKEYFVINVDGLKPGIDKVEVIRAIPEPWDSEKSKRCHRSYKLEIQPGIFKTGDLL